jgi:hypothetical protein
MTYLVVASIALILGLAVVVGVIDTRNAPQWRQVAADRRRAWESTHVRDNYPTGPQPMSARR